jgi:hypothetical protein
MPQWTNLQAAIAAKNGTSSHTMTYSVTPAAGALLVAVICGGVTNTEGGSWTERQQPVNNSENSAFTKTASGGSESITVTHNASDYAVAYALFEFPPGSSWVTSTSAANTNTWPTLSGLPGTAVSVFGALSEAHANGDPSYSATWNSPWLEAVDQEVLFNVTDGIFQTIGYQDGVTATSATPSATDSSNRTSELIVFAVSIGTPLTPLNDNSDAMFDMTDGVML